MAFDLNEIHTLAQMVAADANLQQQVWSQSVIKDARDSNPLKDFIGEEGSGRPIVEKKDAKVQGGQKVHFTTMAPVRGRGVMGANELKSKTARLRYATFPVIADLRRFAISEEQLVQFFSLPGNAEKNRDEVLFDLCKEWWSRTQCDDAQFVLRDRARFASGTPNLLRIGGSATTDGITMADTFDTTTISDGKNALIGQGALALKVDKDDAGAEVPQFLLFAPNRFLDPLEDEQKFREAMYYAQNRGKENFFFNGKYPVWKNNIIFRHNIVIDSACGRQGSPLMPFALLGKAIPSNVATAVTGGGSYNTDASLTDTILYDFFSYFPGFYWKTYDSESAPTDNATYYAIIYNVTGADRGKYEIVKYTAANNNGNTLTVTRECDEEGITQKTKLTAAGRYSNVHPSGSWIIPCNAYGVPLAWGLHMGAEALFVGKGALEADPIEWGDDFRSKTTGRAHINAQGIQSIVGYSPFEDTIGRYSNYVLLEGAASYPDLDLVDVRS